MIKLKVPLTNESFYTQESVKLNKAALQNIRKTYKSYIEGAAYLTNVPAEIITGVIFIESAGNKNVLSSAGAVGLMQLKPLTANDTIWIENSKKRLSNMEKTVIRKFIGNRLDAILSMKYLNHKLKINGYTGNVITKNDLLQPYFNILVGAIYLGLLIDQSTAKDNLRIENVMLRYNQGYFFNPKGNNFTETLANVKSRTEAYNYLLKMLGKNGIMETVIS